MTAHPLPDPVARAFCRQAASCRDLGSPLVAALCALVAERGLPDSRTRRRIATWPGLARSDADAVPLRLCGALHRLVLDEADAGLAAAFPPAPLDRDRLWRAAGAAVTAHDAFIAAYLDRPPQTNEVARSALLLPALLDLQRRHGLPIRLLELGASAGLNQNLDRFHYDYGAWQWGDPAATVSIPCQWRGDGAAPDASPLTIAARAGCDIAPVPIATYSDRKRLQSYVWPDQAHRLERLSAAMALAADHPAAIARGGAADWLAQRLAEPAHGRHTIVFHTVMWQYLSEQERARAENTMRRAGRPASPDSPLAWLRFEADGERPGGGILVTEWRGGPDDGVTRMVARGDFHGRWIAMAA